MFKLIWKAIYFGSCLSLIVLLSSAFAQSWPLVVCAHTDDLPYSDRQASGFENRLASVIADELDASLIMFWYSSPLPRAPSFHLIEGDCDLLMSVAAGQGGLETSVSYYQSGYVFLQRTDHPQPITSFDDEALKSLTIGVQQPLGQGVTPPIHALASRSLLENQRTYTGGPTGDGTLPIIQDILDRTIDIAIIWGPLAGFYAANSSDDLSIEFVEPQIDQPFVPMMLAVSIGMRSGDVELRDLVNRALAQRWSDIQEMLNEYSIPLQPVPRPNLSVETQ